MEETLKNIHTVSSLTYEIKNIFETNFKSIKVKGEVSNLKRQQSGHIYFTLKDKSSSIAVALFAGHANRTSIPKDGDEIIIEGEISVYAPRGSYQIIAKKISKTGLGDLLLQLHKLKEELSNKGYFEKSRKKTLPKFPKKIGVVTSGTGSVIKDIINVLSRRYPNFQLILNPVAVQGKGAEYEIAKAIDDLNHHQLVDVIIVGRGGGSLEDLFCFNEKVVADAIFSSSIPIISACGHETDFTIADFVADVRAPTPSAAAEIVVVDKKLIKENLFKLKNSLTHISHNFINSHKTALNKIAATRCFQSPYSMLSIFIQNLDLLSNNINETIKKHLHLKRAFTQEKKKVLTLVAPHRKIDTYKEKLLSIQKHLHSLNPKNVLKKGYSLVLEKNTKKIISSHKQLKEKQEVYLQLGSGGAYSKIEKIKEI